MSPILVLCANAYDKIDYQIVWDVLSADLPVLEGKLRPLLQ